MSTLRAIRKWKIGVSSMEGKDFVIGLLEIADLNDKDYKTLYSHVIALKEAVRGSPIRVSNIDFYQNVVELYNNYYRSKGGYPDLDQALLTLKKYIEDGKHGRF